MTDFAIFKRGGIQYPLPSSTANPLLKDADPALWYTIDFYKSVLKTYVEPRLLAEAVKCSAPITTSVAMSKAIDPGSMPIDPAYRFPLLAVYRQSSVYEYKTTVWTHTVSQWGVTYLLPPLASLGQAEPLVPIFKAIEDTLLDRTDRGMDPAYSSGLIWPATAGIEQMQFMKGSYGLFNIPDGRQFYLGWRGTLQVIEREMKPTGAFGAFTAADMNEDLTSNDQTTIANIVQAKTDVPLAPSGFSNAPIVDTTTPATGGVAGGTAITLKGSNFFSGAAVSLDGIACTSVVVVDSHTITCVTPAHVAGLVSVAVVNANGKTGFGLQEFTFA